MYRSLIFALLWISSVLSGTYSGSGKPGALDGSYRFIVLGSPFQINVCTNSDGETYMSMNVVNTEDCDESNYILGVYRDLGGPQKIGDDTLALIMNGFQRELPLGNGFDEMEYEIECDTKYSNKHRCKLSRNNGAEKFKLEKISNTATVNCYKPGGKFSDISFPAYYRTIDDISECSVCAGKNPCFEEQSVSDVDLDDACWAFTDNDGDVFTGGPMTSIKREWDGQLSLENYDVSGSQCGVSGSQITVLDGTNIVFSWRNFEGTQGYLYTMEQINLEQGIDDPGCPLFENL